jgi:hypothetical protein
MHRQKTTIMRKTAKAWGVLAGIASLPPTRIAEFG